MRHLGDAMRDAEAALESEATPGDAAALGRVLGARATRRRRWRHARVGTGIAVAVVVAGLAVGGLLPDRGDPAVPIPSLTALPTPTAEPVETVSPSPEPTEPSAAPVPTIIEYTYDAAAGLTSSANLPEASAITPEIWDEVTSGWVIATYGGGLLEHDPFGPLGADYYPPAAPGPRVVYAVSPGGETFEVANLTELGFDDLVAFDPPSRRGLAYASESGDLAVVDLESRTVLQTVPYCANYGRTAERLEAGWVVASSCYSDNVALALVIGDDGVVTPLADAVNRVVVALGGDPAADFRTAYAWVRGSVIQARTIEPDTGEMYPSLWTLDGEPVPLDLPFAPSAGGYSMGCSLDAPLSPGVIGYHCDRMAENADGEPELGTIEHTFYEIDVAERTVTEVGSRYRSLPEAGVEEACRANDVTYLKTYSQQAGGGPLGIAVADGHELQPVSPDAAFIQECVGTSGDDAFFTGTGQLWRLSRSGEWTMLLGTPEEPLTEQERWLGQGQTLTTVQGVWGLGVFPIP